MPVQKTDYSGLIRRILQDEGLAGQVQKLPLERKFRLDSVKDVRSLYTTLQTGPENALRSLS